ncbi:MAG: HAD family hydrolase [Haloferacaceae archaeon]
MYDAVLFDNDGVLVGRTRYDVLVEAAWRTFDELGVPDPDPDHVDSVVVDVAPGDVESVCAEYDLDPERFWHARDRIASDIQQTEAAAGRKTPYEDVSVLSEFDVPLGVVSSNQQRTVEHVLGHFDLDGHFRTLYGREPTVESLALKKPNAHYLNRAMADLDAERALFVGDNESDIAAADNAGIDSAFIRRPHRRDHELDRNPTYVVEDLHDLVSLTRRSVPRS